RLAGPSHIHLANCEQGPEMGAEECRPAGVIAVIREESDRDTDGGKRKSPPRQGREGLKTERDRRAQAALVTLPLRMQRVHTFMVLRVEPTTTCTVCRLGCQVRLVLLLAWETLFPTPRRLSQISHTRA